MELNKLYKQNLTRNLRMGSGPNVGLATKQVELEHQNVIHLGNLWIGSNKLGYH